MDLEKKTHIFVGVERGLVAWVASDNSNIDVAM